MRLLHITNDRKLEFTKDFIRNEDIPPYAILSHTWGEEEVVFHDLNSLDGVRDVEVKKKEGWKKINFCAQQAQRDGLTHFWVDTCCIHKADFTELSEAINSMFRWYQKADKCYVFLSDVESKSLGDSRNASSKWKAAFRASRWFSRGWTLQELLAPSCVEFFSGDGARLGNKESLKQTIHEVTRIPVEALSGRSLSEFSIAERFSWAQDRQTTKEEDQAYCLLGILGCYLPLIYGEGKESAMKRLKREALVAPKYTAGASMENTDIGDQMRKKLEEMCKWLSALDPSTHHNKAYKQRQANTGLWLLESEKLKKWMRAAASRLWLNGTPGCGKTVLSSAVIEHLKQHCYAGSKRITVYFYFDFNNAQNRDPELMLRSLLSQILQQSEMIPTDIGTLFSSCEDIRKSSLHTDERDRKNKVVSYRQPSLHELLKVAPQVLRHFTQVYIVLDALDECSRRPELMNMLETIAGWELDTVHLLMASRKERDIEMSLKRYISEDDYVCLERHLVDRDISLYVEHRLCEDTSLAKWGKSDGFRQEIEAALMRGAHGMFRWAVCQLDSLAKCRNLAMLRKSLSTLPPTLDQTYDRILTSISEEDREYAMRILQWLSFSARPLTFEEISEITAIDVAREPPFNRDEVLIDPLEALDICSSLVTVTTIKTSEFSRPESQAIALAHYSVKEYIVSDRINQGPAKCYSMQEVNCHKSIAKACLVYFDCFQPTPGNLKQDAALAVYAAEFWMYHVQKAGDDVEELDRLASSTHLTGYAFHMLTNTFSRRMKDAVNVLSGTTPYIPNKTPVDETSNKECDA